MKSLILIFCTLFIFNNAYSQSESLVYQRGNLIFKGQEVVKYNDMLNILFFKESAEMTNSVSKFKTNYILSSVFGVIGGVRIGWSLTEAVINKQFDIYMFAGGVGVTALSFFFNQHVTKILKML